MRIKQLSKNLINQIAAGEVIERPASVVKELVENSIDAGSKKISVEIENECRNIRVADNGCGIHPDDIMLAFSKHATSKIATDEDLFNISTLGFRGEALASIISIAKVTCTTRTADFDYGTRVICENSEVKQDKTGCATGTIMQVENLFYNLPARLKFLRNSKTEFSYIHELIQSLALINVNVAFELKHDGKTVLKTTGSGNQKIATEEIFSKNISKNLKEVLKTDKLAGLKISGYASTPDLVRSSKKNYYIYINSRTVKCPIFQKAIDNAYRNTLGNGKYPFVILNLEIPTSDVDVNVHPTKKEVRYHNTNQVYNFIYSAIDMALSNNRFMPVSENKVVDIPSSNVVRENGERFLKIPQNSFENRNYAFKSPKFEPSPSVTTQTMKLFEPLDVQKQQNTEPEENIIGQYRNTYILIEKEDGLEIVDQHIAEERTIYEKLKSQKEVTSQLLFISDVLDISATEAELLKENSDKLERFGYEIMFMSDTQISFKKVPAMISKLNPQDLLTDILENLSGDLDNLEEKILIMTSCKASVKAGQKLNMWQMQEIIKKWRKCEKPYTCPHGRPISRTLPHKEIAAFFERQK
ncbi:DNA mismatch repair endonuclease MutL [bacterium]|nr:DNA mismatch repair endonuclease MutL [bacterium]